MSVRELAECRQRLAAAERFDDIQAAVRTGARRLVDCDGATLVLRDGDECFYVDEDAIAPLWRGQRFPITDCISGWAMLHGLPAVVPDIETDPRIPLQAYRSTFVRSLAMVPIGGVDPLAEPPFNSLGDPLADPFDEVFDGGPGSPVGAIGVYWAGRHAASPEEVALVQHLAAAAGEAIARVGVHTAPVAPRLV